MSNTQDATTTTIALIARAATIESSKPVTRIRLRSIEADYRGFMIVARSDGRFDAVNRTTGRWFTRPTLRRLKWAISVWSNIGADMSTVRRPTNGS